MFNPFKKKRSLEQLSEELKPVLGTKDEKAIYKVFDELISYKDSDPEKVGGLMGWAICVGCESGLNGIGKYLEWYMNAFPDSVIPVRIEYAEFLANNDKPDSATEISREYLRLIKDKGSLSNEITKFPNIQLGCSKAFLIMTAAYTHLGARSYSARILKFASQFPLDQAYLDQYQVETKRLQEELQEPSAKDINGRWEEFFQSGYHAPFLHNYCKSMGCPIIADRVQLLEGNFRFNADYHVEEDELLMLVLHGKDHTGKMVKMLK